MIRVSHIIAGRSAPYILEAEMSAAEGSKFLREHHIGGAPVTRDGELVGFCSERDIVYRIVAKERDPDATKISDIMSDLVLPGSPGDTAVECEKKMRKRHVRHMPILEEGKVVACISLRNLLQSELKEISLRNLLQSELKEYKLEVESLTDYIRGA